MHSKKLVSTIQPSNLFVYTSRSYSQKSEKINIQRSSKGIKLFDGYNEKSRFNGYFNSDFDDFLLLHSLTRYEYNEIIRSSI